MMKKVLILAAGALLFLSVTAQAEPRGAETGDDELLMRSWIQIVASDAFGGRKPMTPHEDLTINYLAGELEKLGLEPAFDGSWFQPFQMLSVTARLEGDKITVKGKKKAQLKYPEDLIVWTARAADKVEIPKAEFVFCGFGIHAPEFGWDDYADVDVKGKIVIAMVNDPGYYDPSLFQGRNMTYYGRWLYKFEEAIRQGAAGCLVLHNTAAASYGWHVCVNGHLEDNLALYDPQTRNADEESGAVVVCAHWDHLGIGTPDENGDSIYNGAADNATGVAGALLTAHKLKDLAVKPRRSIVFLFPSSEESGLFGSAYYCEHPAVPLEKTVACLNYESIGPAPLTRDVVILGGEHSVLAPYYVASAAAQGRYIFFDDDNSDGWFYRSDHYNFVKKGVPAVVMENGLVPANPAKPDKYPMASWYHKPCDEYREDWDLEGTLANVNMVFGVALSLAL